MNSTSNKLIEIHGVFEYDFVLHEYNKRKEGQFAIDVYH